MNPAQYLRDTLFPSRQIVRAFVCSRLVPAFMIVVFIAAWSPINVDAQETAKLVAASGRLSPASIASPDDVSRWIDELGHDAFTVRQAAASRLLGAGMS